MPASCGLWLGEEGLDRRGDDFGLAAAVGRANLGRATVIKAAEYCTPVTEPVVIWPAVASAVLLVFILLILWLGVLSVRAG